MAWFGSKRAQKPAPPPPPAPGAEPTPDPGDSPKELRETLLSLVRLINASSGQLPGAAVVDARHLTDTLAEIIDTSEIRPLDIYTLVSVRGTLDDYLPTTLRAYLAISPELRNTPRPSGRTPTESLMEQLAALQSSASAVLVAVRDQDADALMTQGSFLRTKFTGSDLDLR